MKKIKTIIIAVIMLTACAPMTIIDPAITDIRESMVRVMARQNGAGFAGKWPSMEQIHLTAMHGCGRYGRKAVMMSNYCKVVSSSVYRGCEVTEYLYACEK